MLFNIKVFWHLLELFSHPSDPFLFLIYKSGFFYQLCTEYTETQFQSSKNIFWSSHIQDHGLLFGGNFLCWKRVFLTYKTRS